VRPDKKGEKRVCQKVFTDETTENNVRVHLLHTLYYIQSFSQVCTLFVADHGIGPGSCAKTSGELDDTLEIALDLSGEDSKTDENTENNVKAHLLHTLYYIQSFSPVCTVFIADHG
jgi:hypothetical protein